MHGTFAEFVVKYRYPEFNDSFDRFMTLNGVDDDTVTEDMMEWYYENQWHGYSHPMIFEKYPMGYFVNEMLKNTPISILVGELNRALGGDNRRFIGIWNFEGYIYDLFVPVELYNVNKIKDACDRMMWLFTGVGADVKKHIMWSSPDVIEQPYIFDSNGIKGHRILVEPVRIEPVTDFVKKNCGNKLYHLCLKENTERIMKSGLRAKSGEGSSRLVDKRVYLVCGESVEDIRYNINKVADTKGWVDGEFDIIEVNVGDHNIDFYRDCFYEDYRKYIVYSYGYFPPRTLKIVNNIKNSK